MTWIHKIWRKWLAPTHPHCMFYSLWYEIKPMKHIWIARYFVMKIISWNKSCLSYHLLHYKLTKKVICKKLLVVMVLFILELCCEFECPNQTFTKFQVGIPWAGLAMKWTKKINLLKMHLPIILSLCEYLCWVLIAYQFACKQSVIPGWHAIAIRLVMFMIGMRHKSERKRNWDGNNRFCSKVCQTLII